MSVLRHCDVSPPNGPNLDRSPLGRRNPRRDLDRVVQVLGFDEEVAPELLFGLRERPVGGRELAVANANGGRGIGVLQSVAADIMAALLDVFREGGVVLLR